MEYTVESLPGAVASALPSFASGVAGSISAFPGNDLAVAVDDNDQHYLGLAPAGKPANQVPRSMFSAVVRDGTAVSARLADSAVLKLVRVVPGAIARALVVALLEHWKTAPQAVFSTVGWRISDNAVVVMLAPARGDADKNVIGGATSMGQEVHYHIDAKTFSVLRRTFAR